MSINITGLDKLQRQLKEAENAISTLDGRINELDIDPNNYQSVQQAIQEMEDAIDNKLAPYGTQN